MLSGHISWSLHLIFQVLTKETYNVLVQKNTNKVETVLPVFKVCLNAQSISKYGSFWTSQASKANCRHMGIFRLVLCLCNCSQVSRKMTYHMALYISVSKHVLNYWSVFSASSSPHFHFLQIRTERMQLSLT